MTRAARLLAVILPFAGLAGLWGMSAKTYGEGTEWEVPIQGYDPRDYLRGHYIEFSYDWPGFEEGPAGVPESICLEGAPPQITQVRRHIEGQACAHLVVAHSGQVSRWQPVWQGRLYIGQDRADALQKQLQNRDQRGIVTIRQREDGSFTPISIRFRPLTPAERAERDAEQRQIGTPFDPAAPPPVMIQQ